MVVQTQAKRCAIAEGDPKRFSRVLAAREAIVGAVLAGLLEVGNRTVLLGDGDSSAPGSALALAVAAIGILLSLQRDGLQEHIHSRFAQVDRLADVVDITTDDGTPEPVRGLLHAYVRVTEPEFADVKVQLVVDAIQQLRQLESEKRSETLGTLEYYQWLFRAFEALRGGEYMHAVSLSSDAEWNDSEPERKFLEKNISAAEVGAEISRIFIVPRDRLAAFVQLEPVQAHCIEAERGLKGFFVDKDQLERTDAKLLRSIGEGFIDFNGRVGLEDIFDPDGAVRGQVTLNPSDLTRMRNVYDRLQAMAVPLSSKRMGSASG